MKTHEKIEQLICYLAAAVPRARDEHTAAIAATIPPLLRELRKANYWKVKRAAAKEPGNGG